jgi:hypothetical protein
MNIKDILAVSGMPGLYKLVSSRNNGLVVADLDNGKPVFCPVRKHQFTPLETVAIYTLEDSTELKEVFASMLQQLDDNPPVDPKSDKYVIEEYFESILPDYDEDRVHLSDMKKVIKWFEILKTKGYLSLEEEEE